MVKMSFVPEGESRFHTPVEVSFNLPNDSSLDDYFRAFKAFCFALGFGGMDDYEMEVIDDGLNDYERSEYENCGEIFTEEDRQELRKAFKFGEKFEMVQTKIEEINDKPEE